MNVIHVDDVNIANDNLIGLFLTYYEECCPVQKVYLKDKEENPWMTTSLKNACKKKKYLYIKSLLYKYHTDNNEKDTKCMKISLQLF